MTKSSRAADYRARVSAKSASETPAPPAEDIEEEDDLDCDAAKKKDESMTNENEQDKTKDAPKAEDGVARMKAVFADAKVTGNEARAAQLLADSDYDGLSAEAIVKIVASQPAPAAPKADDDDVGKRMLAAMTAETGDLGSGGKTSEEIEAAKAKANNHGWGDIHAAVEDRRKQSV